MSLLLDSASLDDAEAAFDAGLIQGITTNPSLMKRETSNPLRHLEALLEIDVPEIFYQPTGAYQFDHGHEADLARKLDPDRVILKLPASPPGIRLAARAIQGGARVALTAAQSVPAMILAESLGCEAVIPYVNRSLDDLRTDTNLVTMMVQASRGRTRIVAASIKSSGQLVQAVVDGASDVTAPLELLVGLATHPATIEACDAFDLQYQQPRDEPNARTGETKPR